MMRVRIADVGLAIEMYYSHSYLETKDIMQLLGCGRTVATKLKGQVRELMAKEGVMPYSSTSVDTVCTYRVLQLDIADLEQRFEKLCRVRSRMAKIKQAEALT